VVIGGLLLAKVGYDKYVRWVWPLLAIQIVVALVLIGLWAMLL
jgi:uncharacterized ion transporter superfamily protein YfcC